MPRVCRSEPVYADCCLVSCTFHSAYPITLRAVNCAGRRGATIDDSSIYNRRNFLFHTTVISARSVVKKPEES